MTDKERIAELEQQLAENIEGAKKFCENLEARTQEAIKHDKAMMLARLENIGQVASIAIAYVVKPSDKSYRKLQEAVKGYLKANPDVAADLDKRFGKKSSVNNIC